MVCLRFSIYLMYPCIVACVTMVCVTILACVGLYMAHQADKRSDAMTNDILRRNAEAFNNLMGPDKKT